MKTLLFNSSMLVCFFLITGNLLSQGNVAINSTGDSPAASAMLDVQSSTKGLLVPRMSTADRNNIPAPATGLIVYDLDINSFFFYAGSAWIEVLGGFTTLLADNDHDTKIDVEATTDEDTIKFTVAGTQMAKMDGRTFHLESPGGSVFIGKDAGINDDGTDNTNTFIGGFAGMSNTSGSSNVFLGMNAGRLNEIGKSNIFVGENAGYTNTSGEHNVFIGEGAGALNEDGTRNIFQGSFSGYHNTSGQDNMAFGNEALFSNETGNDNIAIGTSSMITNVDGSENIAIGSWALSQSSGSVQNIAVGHNALTNTTSGLNNTAVGHSAMQTNQTGNSNAAFGSATLANNTTGKENTAIGTAALLMNTTGNQNAGHGTGALFQNTTGNDNVGVGSYANVNNRTGSQNTILGSLAGSWGTLHNKSGNVFIGYKAGYAEVGDNKLYIENSDSANPLIYGDFTDGSEVVGINGLLGVGTQVPVHPLHVIGDGADSVQTVVGMLQSVSSGRPVLLFSENTSSNFASGMSIEYNGAAGTGSSNEMYINYVGGSPMVTFENSGEVGIGTTQPACQLHVVDGTDSAPEAGGFLILGDSDGPNVSFDNNEIMARNNGTTANLYLQANGGSLGIGNVSFDSKVNIRSETGENPLRARIEGTTKFLVHSNGGVAIGANATPPTNGLKVEGDITMDGDDITSTQTLRLNSSTRIELIVGSNTIIIDPVTGISINADTDMIFTAGNDIYFDAGGDIILDANENINQIAGYDYNVDVSHDILIEGDYGIDILADDNIVLDANLNIDMTSGSEFEINGGNFDLNSSGWVEIDGTSTIDLDGSLVRLNAEGNSSATAAYTGSSVNNPPCSTGCIGTVNTGSSKVFIGY